MQTYLLTGAAVKRRRPQPSEEEEEEADVLAERVSGDELGEDPRPLEGGAGEEEDVVAYGGLQPRLVNLGRHVWPRAHLAWFAAARDHVEQSGQLLEVRRVEPDQVLRLDPPHRLLGPRPQPGRLEEGLAREQPARRVDEDARRVARVRLVVAQEGEVRPAVLPAERVVREVLQDVLDLRAEYTSLGSGRRHCAE